MSKTYEGSRIASYYLEEGDATLKAELMPLRLEMIEAAFAAVSRKRAEAEIRTKAALATKRRELAKCEDQERAERVIGEISDLLIRLDAARLNAEKAASEAAFAFAVEGK